jgi:NAD kinase
VQVYARDQLIKHCFITTEPNCRLLVCVVFFCCSAQVYERDQLITKVQADGVMIATPTGSTAYNVAAGGSMVHPSVPAILFTPICPHSLNFRPVILPDYVELEMRIAPGARCSAVANFDGRDTRELHEVRALVVSRCALLAV